MIRLSSCAHERVRRALLDERRGHSVEARVDVEQLMAGIRPDARGRGGVDERADLDPRFLREAEHEAELLAAITARHDEHGIARAFAVALPEPVELRERDFRGAVRDLAARGAGLHAERVPIAIARLSRLEPSLRDRLRAGDDAAALDHGAARLDREHAGRVGDRDAGVVDLDGERAHPKDSPSE